MTDYGQTDEQAVQRFAIRTEDGLALRAEGATVPADQRSGRPGLVVCHPHPLHGGNMYNPVVGSLFSGAAKAGFSALRFNFRGTNGSEGFYQDGVGEQLDVRAAVDSLCSTGAFDPEARDTGGPGIVLAGYSFGADVALQVDHPAVTGWIAVAPPLTVGEPTAAAAAAADKRPVLVLSGTADQFRDAEDTARLVQGWPNTTVVPLLGSDHFLATALRDVQQLSLEFLEQFRQSG